MEKQQAVCFRHRHMIACVDAQEFLLNGKIVQLSILFNDSVRHDDV